jgi:hypothetical protein
MRRRRPSSSRMVSSSANVRVSEGARAVSIALYSDGQS